MMALLIGYNWYNAPTEEELRAQQEEQAQVDDQLSTQDNQQADEQRDPQQAQNGNGQNDDNSIPQNEISKDPEPEEEFFTLSNDLLKVEFSSIGGLPVDAVLLDKYKRYGTDEPVRLWAKDKSSMDISWSASSGPSSLSDLHFHIKKSSDISLELRSEFQQGGFVEIRHQLEGYQVKTTFEFNDVNEGDMQFEWQATGLSNEKGIDWERQHSAIYYLEEDEERDYLSDGQADEETIENKLEWFSFKQNYFSALVSSPTPFGQGAVLENIVPEENQEYVMTYRATVPYDGSQALHFYFGPNDLNNLEATGLEEVGRVIDYGWWIFGWVNRNLILPLYGFIAKYIGNMGLIVLLLTLIIKSVLFPITWKNFMSSAKMRVLRPDLQEINERHKDDAMARQQETMELYRKTGVNPMAGCLPALLQMPILYAMFRFFPSNIDLRGESFLWADDLGAYDSILDLPFHIPLYGSHVSGFTLLMAASMFVYMRMTMANQSMPTQPGMPNMKTIQMIMPFMMLFFFNGFASGLSLYYFTANVVSIGQMVVIKRFFIDEEKIRSKIEENRSKAKDRTKPSFMERLQEAAKEQERKQKELAKQKEQTRAKRKKR